MARYEMTTEQWAKYLWIAEVRGPMLGATVSTALFPIITRLGFTRAHAMKRAKRELKWQQRTDESVQREIFHDWEL